MSNTTYTHAVAENMCNLALYCIGVQFVYQLSSHVKVLLVAVNVLRKALLRDIACLLNSILLIDFQHVMATLS